jgi:methionine sulfoxide reductase catalytic subunit
LFHASCAVVTWFVLPFIREGASLAKPQEEPAMRRLTWSDVTPKPIWLNRRQLMTGAATLLATPALARLDPEPTPSRYSTTEAPNALEDITAYNNFYEFGTGKGDPAEYAGAMKTDPWSIVIDGLVDRPGTYDLADVMKGQPLEERIYRLRCVEAWSMVVPWIGFELAGLLNRVGVLRNPGAARGNAGPGLALHRVALS